MPSHPPMPLVHLLDAGMQAGPLTDRPPAGLATQCTEAAAEALGPDAQRKAAIQAIYLGTMGVQRGREAGGIDPSHVPALVRSRLGLRTARDLHTCTSTSETGAAVFAQAVADLRLGRYQTVLVLAGEQMFSPPSPDLEPEQALEIRRREAREAAGFIRGVVDADEQRHYGLSMLQVGDLLMDAIAATTGVDEAWVRRLLETVTLDKNGLAHGHLRTFVRGRASSRGLLDRSGYRDARRNPAISKWFRREDVCPNVNGATAVVLTTDPRLLAEHGPRVAVLGVGRGDAEVALRERAGPFDRPAAIRRALRDTCLQAGLAPELLLSLPRSCGVIHDPFPAIELLFLRELAGDAGWPGAISAFVTGWGHPLGGLAAAGHALGNSGLFLIAQAFQLATGDRRHLDLASPAVADRLALGAEGARPPGLILTSSVGSALTRVVMTLLADVADPEIAAALAQGREVFDPDAFRRRQANPAPDARLTGRLAAVGPDAGLVLAATEAESGAPGAERHVHAIYVHESAGGTCLRLARADRRHPSGALVRLARDTEPWRILELLAPPPPRSVPVDLIARIEMDLHRLESGRLRDRLA